MTEPTLPLKGGCLCGAVRFEVSEPLRAAGYCHCTRCQRRTGTAASVQGLIAPGSLTILSGEEVIRAFRPENGFPKLFCSSCGSALWSQSPTDPEIISIRLGAFDEDPGIRPQYHMFTAYAVPWEPLPDDGLPRYPERRPPQP